MVDDTLSAELDDLVERRQRNPDSVPEHTATIRAYVIDEKRPDRQIPPAVIALQPGQHQLRLGDTHYRAAVRLLQGHRFVVLYNVSALHRREQGFMLLLGGSVLLVTLVAALSGRWLASRVIASVTELVSRALSLRPGQPHSPLADEFPWIEIQQLATDFDEALARLQAFIERERLFTGDVSHELRTPLAVIAGASELLLADQRLEPQIRERAARIGRAVSEMSEMTGALLALAREQEGRPGTPECEVVEVVSELVQRHRSLLGDRPVALELDIEARPRVPADRAVLSMVFGNLLRNALNFTDEGEVRVCVREESIEVHDTGTGIGDVDVASLFKPYIRSENSKGSGLGLSLVQRLCERQAWGVTLDPLPGGGTLARLQLSPSIRDEKSLEKHPS
ncbi:MAG: HAMP domain-containing sensor histidine kinase [Candidatus Sedimenticola endophacoides]